MLGCLIEKQRTTPDAYPLTLNSLRLACNQATNREPVLDLGESEIRGALERLGQRRWTRLASWSSGRTMKYRHMLGETLGLTEAELSLLAVLMLRGPQTPGELRQRSERLHRFGEEELGETLAGLEGRELVRLLPRRPGQREQRYEQLLGAGSDMPEPEPEPAPPAPAPAGDGRPRRARGAPRDGARGAARGAPRAPRRAGELTVATRGIVARGPWQPEQVRVTWLHDAYEPPAEVDRLADSAVDALRERGSPCHDGLSTRLASFAEVDGGLVAGAAAVALGAAPGGGRRLGEPHRALRGAYRGRALARRAPRRVGVHLGGPLGARARAGRWTSARARPRRCRASCARSGSSRPQSLSVEALVGLPNGMAMVVGLATVADALGAGAGRRARRVGVVGPRPGPLARPRGRPRAAHGPAASEP